MPMARLRNLILRIYSRDVMVHSDKRLLRRVLQNFISNALRYTAEGRIVIGVRVRDGKEVEFQVWDTGQGIPTHHLQQIFRSEEHTSELQSRGHFVCGLLLE